MVIAGFARATKKQLGFDERFSPPADAPPMMAHLGPLLPTSLKGWMYTIDPTTTVKIIRPLYSHWGLVGRGMQDATCSLCLGT